jgi:hypothetical protein
MTLEVKCVFGLTTEDTEDHGESQNPRPVSPKTGETRTGHPPFQITARAFAQQPGLGLRRSLRG